MPKFEQLQKAIRYPEYLALVEDLVNAGKTSGHEQSETKVYFTKLNLQRMSRLGKTTSLLPELKHELDKINKSYIWLVITESWCGDAAQILPLLHLIEKHCPWIELRLLFRDENPQLMNHYLTGGASSIPKLICIDKLGLEEIFVWGPRPAAAQALAASLKQLGVGHDEKALAIQKWYIENKTLDLQHEFLQHIQKHLIPQTVNGQ